MATTGQHGVDSSQVKKAIQALLAVHKAKKKSDTLLLNEHERILLMVTVWKIPKEANTIKIALPHGFRSDSCDVCLFTRDEPGMSSEQTERFYKKLLSTHGITQITEIIPLKKMKTEYKPFEAKRRLLGNYELFLADARIHRLLPSQIGSHFYKAKKEPISIELKKKELGAYVNRLIQTTLLHTTNKGCCYSVSVGHTGMTAEQVVENVLAAAKVLNQKFPMTWKNIKILHLKTLSSVALPIYNSSLDNLKELHGEKKKKLKKKKPGKKSQADKKKDAATPQKEQSKEDDEEEIPQLVPITEPSSADNAKKETDRAKSKKKKKRKSPAVNVEVSSEKTTPKKLKPNESRESIKTPNKITEELPPQKNDQGSEKQETTPKLKKPKKNPNKKTKLDPEESSQGSDEQLTTPKPITPKKTRNKNAKQLQPEENGQVSEEQLTTSKHITPAKTPNEKTKEPPPPQRNDQGSEEQETTLTLITPKKNPNKKTKPQQPEESGQGPEEQETTPKPITPKKTPNKKTKPQQPEESGQGPEEQETTPKPITPKKTPNKKTEELPPEESGQGSEEVTSRPKRNLLKKTPRRNTRELPPKENDKGSQEVTTRPKKTPSKRENELAFEENGQESEKQVSPAKRPALEQTPKKAANKSGVKSAQSAKKAPQTPNLRPRKKMNNQLSV